MKPRFWITPPLAASLVLLGACSVGPTYVKPDTASITLASPQADTWGANTQQSLPADWWTFFEDGALNQWVAAALAHNHDIRQAQANLLAARALFDERRLDRLPGVTASGGYTRGIQQQPGNDSPQRTLSESWQAGFDVQWEIDLFGRLDRLQQAARARTQASAAELSQTRLSIAAEITRAWLDTQGTRRQLDVAHQAIENWRETVRLADARHRAGVGLPEELENARANLLRSEAQTPPLTAALQQARWRLDVLAGHAPGQSSLPDPTHARFAALEKTFALGDVGRRILNRPDVRAAERQLAASVEDVGAATAELYPRFDLGGLLGFFALRDGDFASAASRAFQITPSVTWPAFRLANARARLRATEAQSEGALARYEQVLLTAQEEVENALTRLGEQQRQLALLLQSANHAQAAFDYADKRYRAGSGSYQSVLENQRTLLDLRQNIAQEETRLQSQFVVLMKALGWQDTDTHISENGS